MKKLVPSKDTVANRQFPYDRTAIRTILSNSTRPILANNKFCIEFKPTSSGLICPRPAFRSLRPL
jgi:hypothetical protein